MAPRARHFARRRAMQAHYQLLFAGTDPMDLERQFREEQDLSGVDMAYFLTLLHQVPAQFAALDALIAPHADRAVASIDPIERSILRIACYELKERLDVPYKVVINEAVDLAKLFGADQGHRYVNGVVDKLAPQLRSTEYAR